MPPHPLRGLPRIPRVFPRDFPHPQDRGFQRRRDGQVVQYRMSEMKKDILEGGTNALRGTLSYITAPPGEGGKKKWNI